MVGAVFLFIEFASLVTGIVMTRTITSAVDDLYRATQHVQAGDLSFRVRVPHRDQLAALGESFNSMTQSVSTLIEEQRKRQRLENELSIAHEVQQQLFPHTLPKLPGRRTGSDLPRGEDGQRRLLRFHSHIAHAPGHRARRHQREGNFRGAADGERAGGACAATSCATGTATAGNQPGQINTAEIISHLNRHLFRNSSDERYATCFFGVYDTQTRRLNYTNAGHLPPIYICDGHIARLETGGMVVGLFNDVPFEQGTLEIEPGGLLIAYSDGLIEPENVYGEEFGTERLIEVATARTRTLLPAPSPRP